MDAGRTHLVCDDIRLHGRLYERAESVSHLIEVARRDGEMAEKSMRVGESGDLPRVDGSLAIRQVGLREVNTSSTCGHLVADEQHGR